MIINYGSPRCTTRQNYLSIIMFGKVTEDSFRDILLESSALQQTLNKSQQQQGHLDLDVAALIRSLSSTQDQTNMIWQGLSTQQSQLPSGVSNLNFSNAELMQQLSAIAKLWSVEQSHQQQLSSPTARITDSPTSSTSSAVLRKHSIPSQIQQQSLNNTAQKVNTSRYKTELCRPFGENGHCKYGEKCQFAHGDAELRQIPRHPKYKSERCRTYHTSGFCPYGPRCHFVHNEEDLKKKQQQAQAQQAAVQQQQQQQAAQLLAGSITNPAAFAQLPMYTPPPASELPKLLQMRLRNTSESDHMSVVSGSSSASSTTSSDVEQDLADQHHGFATFQNLRFAAASQQANSAGSSLASSPSAGSSGLSSSVGAGSRLPVFAKLMN